MTHHFRLIISDSAQYIRPMCRQQSKVDLYPAVRVDCQLVEHPPVEGFVRVLAVDDGTDRGAHVALDRLTLGVELLALFDGGQPILTGGDLPVAAFVEELEVLFADGSLQKSVHRRHLLVLRRLQLALDAAFFTAAVVP